MPRGVFANKPHTNVWYGQPCECHPAALGHHYDSDLRCINGGCFTTWAEQQEHPTRCEGLWVQQQASESQESA